MSAILLKEIARAILGNGQRVSEEAPDFKTLMKLFRAERGTIDQTDDLFDDFGVVGHESSIPFTRFRSAWQWSFSGQARFGVMSGNGKAEARSESGPPERWRRRAFSYVYVLRFDQ